MKKDTLVHLGAILWLTLAATVIGVMSFLSYGPFPTFPIAEETRSSWAWGLTFGLSVAALGMFFYFILDHFVLMRIEAAE